MKSRKVKRPGMGVPEQKLTCTVPRCPGMEGTPGPPRKDVSFLVNKTTLSAWLYLPEGTSGPVPCVIMGNGTGGTKDIAGLERYAARYREAERQLGRNAEARYYPLGHFDIYMGEGFERAVRDQVRFLEK
jgi:hypothetical protein